MYIDISIRVLHITVLQISAFGCLDKLVIRLQMDITLSQIPHGQKEKTKREKPVSVLKTSDFRSFSKSMLVCVQNEFLIGRYKGWRSNGEDTHNITTDSKQGLFVFETSSYKI